MFDRIDQPPEVPLYPGKRALHSRPQSTPYSVRRSLDAGAINASPRDLPLPDIPPPRTFKVQHRGASSSRPVHDSSEGGVLMNTLSHPYARAPTPASGRVEIRRSIHPYDLNGSRRWRVSGVGNSRSDNVVGTRAEPPPHHVATGPRRSAISVNPPGYSEVRPDTSRSDETRVRTSWSQQPPGEWHTETGSSAAAGAGSMTGRGSRGPAWGGGGGGTWS